MSKSAPNPVEMPFDGPSLIATNVRQGTAVLANKMALPGRMPQQAYSGEVAFDSLGNPCGVRVPMGPHHASLEYVFIPASACDSIQVRK